MKMLRVVTCGRNWAAGLVLVAAFLLPRPALALINVTFTPVQVVRQADTILQVELGPVGPNGAVPVRIVKAMKGTAPSQATLGFSHSEEPHAKAFRDAVGSGKQLAAVFLAKPKKGGDDGDGAAKGESVLMHVDGQWFRLSRSAGAWELVSLDEKLQAVWAGGTDMLLRGVEYVLADPDAAFPVTAGVGWGTQKKIATVEGKVHAAMPVDLLGDGRLSLFVCCERGDRVFQCQPRKEEFADVTAKLKLGSKSRCAAWADFDADGRLDLASFDGKQLSLWHQTAAGAFEHKEDIVLPTGCTGIAALDVGVPGRAGLAISTDGTPLLLVPKGDGKFELTAVVGPAAGKFAGSGLGEAHACLVADFDNDGIADILQPLAKGSLLYRGTKPGGFAGPQISAAIATGPGRAAAFTGDYDADGLLDIFVAAEERCCLWRNLGAGKFTDAMRYAGEAGYIAKPGAIGGATCDINNDGRQDIFILYPGQTPQIFFSRGFSSFGHAHQPIDLGESNALPAAADGQQAGLVADLNGDGGQDMALVLANGEVWVFLREVAEDTPPLAAHVGLSAKGTTAGPVTVRATAGKRPLGAWNVVPGTAEAFFGLTRSGPCTIEWHAPGPAMQRKQLAVHATVYVPLP